MCILIGVNIRVTFISNQKAEIILTESNDSSVIDLCFYKCRAIKISFRADLDIDTAMGRLGIVHGASTSFDVAADTVVVAGAERVEVVQTM